MVSERAYAKVNIGLDVLGRRPDGYHELRMIMQTVDICDDLTFEKRADSGVSLRIDGAALSAGQDNLICRAAALFMKEKRIDGGVFITLKKRIPIAAGMAGGSADAAATLRGLNALFETGCSAQELRELGVERSEELCFYALCVVRSPVGESTVNLRCPVAVNEHTGKAMQVILESGDYHMRHLLSEFSAGKGEGPC